MDVDRRFVVRGLSLCGIAGFAMTGSASGHSTRASADSAAASRRASTASVLQLALVSDETASSAFVQGAGAAGAFQLRVHRVSRDLREMLALERQFRSSEATRIIGLLDDASGTLVVDLARAAGARVQWLGQHTAHGSFSRHHLVDADRSDTRAHWFERQLRECGAGFHIVCQQQGELVSPRRSSGSQRRGANAIAWASAVGYLLALDAPTLARLHDVRAAPASPRRSGADGRFVSFSIELGEARRG